MDKQMLRVVVAVLALCVSGVPASAQPAAAADAAGKTSPNSQVAGKTRVRQATVKPKRTRATGIRSARTASSKKTLKAAERERARVERKTDAGQESPLPAAKP